MSAVDDIFDRPQLAADWNRRIRPVPSNSDLVQVAEYADARAMQARYAEIRRRMYAPVAPVIIASKPVTTPDPLPVVTVARQMQVETPRATEISLAAVPAVQPTHPPIMACELMPKPTISDPDSYPGRKAEPVCEHITRPSASDEAAAAQAVLNALLAAAEAHPLDRKTVTARLPRTPPARYVLELAAAAYGFSVNEIVGPVRRAVLVEARHRAIYAVHTLCPHLGLPAIGRLFGNRDHTTALHAVRKIAARHGTEQQQAA